MELDDEDQLYKDMFTGSHRLDVSFDFSNAIADGSSRWMSKRNTKRTLRRTSPEDLKHLESYINMNFKLDLQVQRLVSFVSKRRVLEERFKELKAEFDNVKDQLQELEEVVQPARELVFDTTCAIFLSLAEFPLGGELRTRLERNMSTDSDWMEIYCKNRGGCCAHKCGCCLNPREGIVIKGSGHCTSACICCEKRRGKHIDTSNGDPDAMVLDIDKLPHSREALGFVDFFIGYHQKPYPPLPWAAMP